MRRRGDFLIGMLLAIMLSLLAFQQLFSMQQDAMDAAEQKLVVEQMAIIGKSVEAFIQANSTALRTRQVITGAPATLLVPNADGGRWDGTLESLAEVLAPYFPSGTTAANITALRNAWGDQYRLALIREFDPTKEGARTAESMLTDTITGYLYTRTVASSRKNRDTATDLGKKFVNSTIRQTAMRGGASFGFCDTAGTLKGGAWQVDIPNIAVGHVGYLTNMDSRIAGFTALSRYATGDPDTNRMHADIDLDDNSLLNVKYLDAAEGTVDAQSLRLLPYTNTMVTTDGRTGYAAAEWDCQNNMVRVNNDSTGVHQLEPKHTWNNTDGTVHTVDNDGRLFYINDGSRGPTQNSIAVCRRLADGTQTLAFIGDSRDEDSIRFIVTASDGDEIDKFLCPATNIPQQPFTTNYAQQSGNYAVSVPRLYVMPTAISTGAESKPVSAFRAWAVDTAPSTPGVGKWHIHVAALVKDGSKNHWYGSSASGGVDGMPGTSGDTQYSQIEPWYLRVTVIGVCSTKGQTF